MSDSPFVGPHGEPRLVDCAVLFFDLIGVRAMAQGESAEEELVHFNRTIRDAVPYPIGTAAAAEAGGAYPTTVFSDSVVQAVPILPGLPPALAIFQVVQEVAQLQTTLAMRRYVARGAITLGKFHTYDGLIFGPALVEAVSLEQTVAKDPRIVLSPAAATALLDVEVHGLRSSAPLLIDRDGVPFVDYLTGAFELDPTIDLTSTLSRHREVVDGELKRQAANFHRWSKHRWVAEYHNATCLTFAEVLADSGGHQGFLIDSIHTQRDFRPLRRVDEA